MTLWPRLGRDFARLRTVKGRGFWMALADALFFDAGFQALLAHRIAHTFARWGVPVLPALCRRLAVAACAVDILPRATIGGGCIVAHGVGLVVGGQTVIGEDCTLLHGVTLGEVRFDELDCPRVGDRVTIGAGAKVLGGITVGDDAVVGAGAVVLADVPPGAVVAGVPARVIGRREERKDREETTSGREAAAGVPARAAAGSTAASDATRQEPAPRPDPGGAL